MCLLSINVEKWSDSGVEVGSRKVVSVCKMGDWERVRLANINGKDPLKKGKINDVEKGEDNWSSNILEEEKEDGNGRADGRIRLWLKEGKGKNVNTDKGRTMDLGMRRWEFLDEDYDDDSKHLETLIIGQTLHTHMCILIHTYQASSTIISIFAGE